MSFIELHHVKKEFQGKEGLVSAVNNVSLTIEKGEIFGIVGYSGAGKSTLIRLLNGLEQPTSGEVIIGQQDVVELKGAKLRDYRKRVGMVFQHFNLLWSRTVRENILLPLELEGMMKEEREARAAELIQLVGLKGREDAYPAQLSGGQKQRVGIARALANKPDILLCDEATSALDPQTTDEVLELLLAINRQLNLTIVLITHEMHVIRKICHRVAVMEAGRVVETGEVLQVFHSPQQAVTKRFVQQELLPENEPTDQSIDYLIQKYPQGLILQLKFTGEQSKEPVISKVIKQTNVDLNVLQGTIQQNQEVSFGTMLVQVTGTKGELAAAFAYFKEQKVGVEVKHHE